MRVLVVCTANVCRSPFAAALLANRLLAIDPGTTITVGSAGSRAQHGAAACEVAAARAADGGFPLLGHASRPLDVATIDGADLILTAEAAHRSAVSRLVPGARGRTFTISEAAGLADIVAERAGVEPAQRPSVDGYLAWVQSLDGARGLLPRAGDAPVGLWRRFVARPTTPSIDIVDGHLLGARQHRATLLSVEQAIDRLATAMAAIG